MYRFPNLNGIWTDTILTPLERLATVVLSMYRIRKPDRKEQSNLFSQSPGPTMSSNYCIQD